jgi:4'-phosphopantetheinyl transferase
MAYGRRPAVSTLASVFPQGFGSGRFDHSVADHVLVAVFALDDWRAWTTEAFALIDARELMRVRRQRRDAHQDSLALAYALHRLFLSHALRVPLARVPLARDSRGRPVLEGMAADTSLSHADGHVAVAVSLHGPVGVDIEPAHRAGVMPEIAGRICHGDELARFAGLRDAQRAAGLLDLWVRKEAYLKAAGVGLEREMDTFALPEGEAQALHPGDAVRVGTDLLSLGPDIVCAVAKAPEVACRAGRLRPVLAGGVP